MVVSVGRLSSIVGRLLRESDLGGKSDQLVARLKEINGRLEKHGARVGLVVSKDVGGFKIGFGILWNDRDKRAGVYRGQSSSIPYRLPGAWNLGAAARDIQESTKVPFTEEEMGMFMNEIPYGHIDIVRVEDYLGPCGRPNPPWVVQWTNPTRKGWGPMLYDVAIEFATENGGGLMPDRATVSPEANAVWKKYSSSRPDVKQIQLDASDDTVDTHGVTKRTPEESDDCDQHSAVDDKGVEKWFESPLSRVYRKEPKLTGALVGIDAFWYSR